MDNSNGENTNTNESSVNMTDALFDAAADRELRKENVDAIKNRKGHNEPINPKNNDEDDISSKSSSLQEKDELEKKDSLKDKVLDNDSGHKGFDVKKAASNALGVNDLKKKFLALKLKIKALGILALVFLGIFVILMLFSATSIIFETFTNAIVDFFGISENNSVKDEGLYESNKYYYDENGEELNHEDLVKYLNSHPYCSDSKWQSFLDKLTGSGFNGDPCKFLRFVKEETHIEKDGMETDVDTALIIGTLFYGFDTQPNKTQYNSRYNIPSEEEVPDSNEHFNTLTTILGDKNANINKEMIQNVINNSYITVNQKYYNWVIDVDPDTGDKVGKCVLENVPSSLEYSLEKWKIFMRFGDKAAQDYENYLNDNMAISGSSEECNGSKSEADLLPIVESASKPDGSPAEGSSSVDLSALTAEQKPNTNTGFLCYADVDSKVEDNCGSYSYRNGFAYQHFLGYQPAETSGKTNIVYDPIFTPKKIETTIQDIVSKKEQLNDVLLIEDPDVDKINPSNQIGSVVTNAYCKDYVKTPYANMKVKLTDCHGVELDTVTFEDYIIGVANAEVSNKNDNYVLSEMLAAISYALKRRDNYKKGETITMKSGTCDQAYCSPEKGCTVKRNPEICKGCMSFYIGGGRGKNPKLYNKYKELFAVASQFLVVSKGTVHNAHYVSTIQNQWYKKATQGMNFTQIIQETYEKEGAQVIKCATGEMAEASEPPKPSNKVGAQPTAEYPNYSADVGKFYGYSYANGSGTNITINPLWVKENITSVYPTCSNDQFANMEFRIHKDAQTNFNRAFSNICTLLTDGVRLKNGTVCKLTMNNLSGGTVFLEKTSGNGFENLHTYGIAQDWNYNVKYSIGGKTYSPYSSNATVEDYWNFVEAINKESNNSDLYDEENCKNINYILYKYAYEPAGFEWGYSHLDKYNDGNYVSGSFNGKTFVLNR